MRERNLALILTAVLLLAGGVVYYFQINYSDFNFYRTEITANGSFVQENLFYKADRDYHTLFRSFDSPISDTDAIYPNSIIMEGVECSAGNPYFRTANYCYNNSLMPTECMTYTLENEYGCSFGNTYGFLQGEEYNVGAEYELHPENLFLIGGEYFIKFVAYDAEQHKNLVIGENFIFNGGVANKKYFHDEQVIVYIPYNRDISGFNIIEQAGFLFDDKLLKHLILLLMALSPGILFFFCWYFFGRENYEEDIPERLSMYPSRRKAWEVAAFFNTPFGSSNPNLIPTLLEDFYHRKIIDIKIKEKETYIRIKKANETPDNTENSFMKLLKFLEEKSEKDGEYFLFNVSELGYDEQSSARKLSVAFFSTIKKSQEKFLSVNRIGIMLILFLAGVFVIPYSPLIGGLLFISALLISLFSATSSLLVKFKDRNYPEYQKWQAFKKFLSDSSLELHGHKGTIIWGEILVYATALGVAKRVLKEMKTRGIISEEQYNTHIIMASSAISLSTIGGLGGGQGGAGGFGGAGGGGVGGGGGGGR